MSFHRLLILSVARLRWMAPALSALALAGCVGQAAMTPPPPASSVRFGHVFIVVEENANYSDVVASPSMPYLNALADKYGLATNYFANAHRRFHPATLSRFRRQRRPRATRRRQDLEIIPRGSSVGGLHRRRHRPLRRPSQSPCLLHRRAKQRQPAAKPRALHPTGRRSEHRQPPRVFLHRSQFVQRRA